MADLDYSIPIDDGRVASTESTVTAKPENEQPEPSITYQMLAETLGTMIIILVGLSSVNAAIIAQGASGNWQVGIMFALSIAWGIYSAGPISGGHINPAITAAIAILRPSSFPLWKLPCYWFAQFLGGFLGAALNYSLYFPAIIHFEKENGIVRGTPESDLTFAMFGGVFPFTSAAKLNNWPLDLVKPSQAFFLEAFGAAVICFLVFMLLDERNTLLRKKDMAPVLIALSGAALITSFGPLTGGSYNPARDGGPRLFAALAGWGSRAYPGHQNGFWVYFVGPIVGALVGGGLYDFVLTRAYTGKAF